MNPIAANTGCGLAAAPSVRVGYTFLCVSKLGAESAYRPSSLALCVDSVFRSLATFIRHRSARAREPRDAAPSGEDVDVSGEAARGIEALEQLLLTETMYRRLLERDDEDDQPCSQ
jgi:hypothetical protein